MFDSLLKIIISLVSFSHYALTEMSMQRNITIVKQIVIQTCQDHPDSCSPLDLEQFKTKDWIIERYLIEYNSQYYFNQAYLIRIFFQRILT